MSAETSKADLAADVGTLAVLCFSPSSSMASAIASSTAAATSCGLTASWLSGRAHASLITLSRSAAFFRFKSEAAKRAIGLGRRL